MNTENMDRRNSLKTYAFTTGVVGLSLEEKALLAQEAKARESKASAPSIALPMGQIGKLKISRLICGGNLINSHAHARDMIYIPKRDMSRLGALRNPRISPKEARNRWEFRVYRSQIVRPSAWRRS